MTMCICSSVEEVPTRTRVIVLQHPKERFHSVGTIRIIDLALPNSERIPCHGGLLPNGLVFDQASSVLLYPGEGAIDLDGPIPGIRNLIVIDGTWSQAGKIFRRNPLLAEVAMVSFQVDRLSRYLIRKQPKDFCQSSLEAIYYALSLLEPENDSLERLWAPFQRMIARQLEFHEKALHPRIARPRAHPGRGFPPFLHRSEDKSVVVYGEYFGAKTQAAKRSGQSGGAIIHWAALKPDTGEVREWLFEEGLVGLSDYHLDRMGLNRGQAVTTRKSFVVLWSEWLGGPKTVVAWEQRILDLFAYWTFDPDLPTGSLKSAFACRKKNSPGHLQAIVLELGLAVDEVSVNGRAKLRLGYALSMYGYLRNELKSLL